MSHPVPGHTYEEDQEAWDRKWNKEAAMKTHTPIPWKVQVSQNDKGQKRVSIVTSDKYPDYIGSLDNHTEDDEANAEFIVRCVNSHEVLVNAVNRLINEVGEGSLVGKYINPTTWEMLTEAIQQAEGGK